MTHQTYFISDTHFGHKNVIKHCRPQFSSVEEMNEHMVEQWNKTVRPQDKIYHLGDVVINRSVLPILERLNGIKYLVRGNHDVFRSYEYLEYFHNIYGVRVFNKEGFVCSHAPLHPQTLERWKFNVHGHLHEKILPDMRYMCVSVEQTDYRPIHMDEILKWIEAQNQCRHAWLRFHSFGYKKCVNCSEQQPI